MNWLYPRTALDMLFPGVLWYVCLWLVMSGLFVGALLWDLGVWAVNFFRHMSQKVS